MCLDIWLMNVVALTRLWSHLILHYLGLDHVGHLGGRKSMLMAPKLGEMDEVTKTIDLNSLPTNNNDQGRILLLTNNRLLELNSWQLLRLLEVQLPGLVCENFLCDDFRDDGSERTSGYSSLEETICCLYMKAADLGSLGKSQFICL